MQEKTYAASGTTATAENVNYNDSVLKKIVNTAATQVDGVLGLGSTLMENISGALKNTENTHGVSISRKNDALDVDVKLVVEFGRNIPQIASDAEANIRKSLMDMAGLNANAIKVEVVDTMTRAEFEEKTKQGKQVSDFVEKKQDEHEARKVEAEAKKEEDSYK